MHFGIVPLLAFHDDHKNGKYYFVSPFLVNGDLFDVIQCDTYYIRNKMQVKLIWEKRVKIMYQIASALDYMHAGNKFRGTILHMDIKSKNIVLDSKFNARLIDFGLSRELKEGDESLAVTALPLGTKGYYPTMQHNMLTKQHDYHNFGVVILELITGLEACTTDQGLELRKWNLRRIKDRQQDEVWIISGIVEQLSNIALECIASVSSTCKKPITSDIVLSRLTEVVRKNSVTKWEALNDGRCEVCLVNLQFKDGVDGHDFDAGDCSERIRAVDCSERIRTCCACMRNSFINPIICHTCGNTIKPFINESWGAILLSGYDKTDGEGCEEGANVFHTEIVKFKDVITSKVLPAMCLSEKNVIIVPRDDANSRETIANQIDEAFTVLAQKDIQTLLFVYSGHNNMDQGFQIDKNEYYPISTLRTKINTLKQSGGKLEKVIALIDCCEPEWLDLDKSIKVIQLNATGQTEEAGATRSQGSHFLSYIIQAFTASANGGKCKHPGCACIEHLKPGFITVEHLWHYVDEHRKNGHMIGNGPSKTMQGIDWKNTIIAYNYDFEVQFKFTIVWPSTSIKVPACVSPNMCTSFVALKEILADEVIKHVYGFNTNDCGIKSELADIISIEIDTGPRVYNVEEIDNEEKLLLAWNSKRMLRCTPRRLHNIDTTKPVGLFLKDCKDVQTKHLECSIQQPFSLKDLERFKNMLEQMETNSLEKSLKEYTDALDVIIHRKKEKQLQDNDLQVSFFDLPENYTFVYMKFVQKLSVVST
ncbi:uncharacterized protein LOC127848698 isoform X1 [Dreissena polymorpha]|uniref:Protein kinase domain-containing protein n=1 Tax=Dreissena polymorpha TaxID=45954 RepID=A0A9D4DBL0_DREPO|nr:uncharacterized protein LOC127848698 isoform X1 [Dreissena polymorpha]KAH3746399.1 hypothetical protein DPMN_180806 [Dreissena polymorpha]